MIEIFGHDAPISYLRRLVEKEMLPNSLLFTGRRGVGKYTAALWLSAFLSCVSKEKKPCGICRFCRNTEKLNFVDLRVVSPDEETLNIKMEQIREIVEDASFSPSESPRKIVIIRNAERMTEEAANCLLKILEEPPSYMLFILTAPNAESLLPTILSRCSRVRFGEVSADLIYSWLEKKGIDSNIAKLAASVSCGSPGEAAEFTENHDSAERRFNLMSVLVSLGKISSFALSDRINYIFPSVSGADFINITDYLSLWLRDIMAIKSGVEDSIIINRDFLNDLKRQSKEISFEAAYEIFSLISETGRQREYNVAPALAADRLLQRAWLAFRK